VAFAIGVLVAVQARVNGELGHELADGVAAALISFGTGGALLFIATLVVPRVRRGLGRVWSAIRTPSGGLRWYQCVGGLSGAFLVASQSLTVATLGVAVFTVGVVAGQAASALMVDRHGIGPGGIQPITVLRLVGAATALVAVVLAVSDRLSHPSGLALVVLPAVGGAATAVQQGLNGRVARVASRDAYGAVSAAVINFLVGSTALALVFAVDLLTRGAPRELPSNPWLYIGGACGVAFITLAAAVVRVVGVFVLGLGTIAGQLVGSLLLDLTLPAADGPVTLTVVAGTVLALAAVVVTAAPGLRRT
jgi:bacterial/archaeal transporter family-2 protein